MKKISIFIFLSLLVFSMTSCKYEIKDNSDNKISKSEIISTPVEDNQITKATTKTYNPTPVNNVTPQNELIVTPEIKSKGTEVVESKKVDTSSTPARKITSTSDKATNERKEKAEVLPTPTEDIYNFSDDTVMTSDDVIDAIEKQNQ